MNFQDRPLTCTECQKTFTFTAGEQKFFAEKGLQSEPKRCEDCRARRKSEGRGAPRGGGGGGGGPRQKFPATCSRCGANFEAPFEPKPDRPILCRDCFQKR